MNEIFFVVQFINISVFTYIYVLIGHHMYRKFEKYVSTETSDCSRFQL